MNHSLKQSPMSRTCAILIGAGLIYLAIPNLLFLVGWYTPFVALLVGAVAVFAVLRCVFLLRQKSELSCEKEPSFRCLFIAPLLLMICLLPIFLSRGIVGVFGTHWDYFIFRQALFCNMRDAAWPVFLPDGREMSYYLANMLPPALMARVLPSALGQWCIVFWSLIPMCLTLLILADGDTTPRWKGYGFLAVFLAIFAMSDPVYILLQDHMGHYIRMAAEFFGCDRRVFFDTMLVLSPLRECIGAYNSVPPTLLATAILAKGGRENRRLVPLVYALLLAVAPIACVGLLPVAVVLYIRSLREEKHWLRAVVAESLLPLMMLAACAVYYQRGESGLNCTLSVFRMSWADTLAGQSRAWVAWVLLVLPLVKWERNNGLFWAVVVFLLIAPIIHLGAPPSDINELWIKTSPAYLTLLALFWVKRWSVLPKIKYVVASLCLLGTVHIMVKFYREADFSRYGVVRDIWNGHLNHPHPFLRQSVPPTREPLVPGMLLRRAGESERHFPGSLLPQAPGCDYTRPVSENAEDRKRAFGSSSIIVE